MLILEIGSSLRALRYHLIRPTSEIKFEASFNISEVLRRLADIYTKQSIADFVDLGDFFYDIIPSLQAVVNSLEIFDKKAEEFKQLLKESSSLLSSVQRLESQAKAYPSDDLVTQLSEKYYRYQIISNQMQKNASYLNYIESFLSSEKNYYREVIMVHFNCLASRTAIKLCLERLCITSSKLGKKCHEYY